MLKLYQTWLSRALVPGQCVACARSTPTKTCSDECARRLQTLCLLPMGEKRLLEADFLEELTDDLLGALFEVSYPLRERDPQQFRALVAWRHLSQRYKRVVDQVLGRMQRLPRAFRNMADDAVLALLPHLRTLRLTFNGNNNIEPRLSPQALEQLTLLQTLRLPEMYSLDITEIQSLRDRELYSAYGVSSGTIVHPWRMVPDMIARAPRSLTALDLDWADRFREWYNDDDEPDSTGVVRSGPEAPIPPLGHLSGLQQLTLHDLQTHDPQRLAGLSQLTRLKVRGSIFTGPLPSEVSASLTSLNLYYVAGFDTNSLRLLTALRELTVDDDDDLSELAEALPYLTLLERLSLTNITDDALRPLTRLTALDLSYTEVSDASMFRLADQLLELTLGAWNRVTDAGLGALRRLHTLRLKGKQGAAHAFVPVSLLSPLASTLTKLDLRGDRTDLRVQVAQLTRLRKLCMPSDGEPWSIETLEPLTQLQSLYMNGNAVFWTHQLSMLPQLTHLRQSPLFLYGPDYLYRLSNLVRLALPYHPDEWLVQMDGFLAMSRLQRLKLSNTGGERFDARKGHLSLLPTSCYVTFH